MRALSASKYIEHKEHKERLLQHQGRLKEIASTTKRPVSIVYKVPRGEKKAALFFKSEMNRNNNFIRRDLRAIDDGQGPYNVNRLLASIRRPPSSNADIIRRNTELALQEENRKMFYRIDRVKSHYRVKEWDKQAAEREKLMMQMSSNARRLNPLCEFRPNSSNKTETSSLKY